MLNGLFFTLTDRKISLRTHVDNNDCFLFHRKGLKRTSDRKTMFAEDMEVLIGEILRVNI